MMYSLFGIKSVVEKFVKSKESAYNSSAKSCERDKVTLTEYDDEKVKLEANIDELEDERSAIASKLATIDSLPELANDRASIEEKNHQVCLLQEEIEGDKRAYAEKKKNLSRKNDKEIENIEEEIGRQSHELIKECKHVLAQEETLQANLDVCNERLEELDRSCRFAWGFTRSIGCGGNELGHTCALDNPDLLSQDTLRDSFYEGVEKGLPEELDPLSRLFDEGSGLMTHMIMKRFFLNIGWDRSPSFPAEKRIRVDKIRSTVYNDKGGGSKRIHESVQQMNLRLQLTIFGDERLPTTGHNMRKRMTQDAAQAAKVKAEEQANDQKKLAAAPTSTRKRNPF